MFNFNRLTESIGVAFNINRNMNPQSKYETKYTYM